MLAPRSVRRLTVDPGDHPRAQPHWSAASGMVRAGNDLYIVADDEHHLARLDATGLPGSRIQAVRFTPGDLPQDARQRKKRKPDVEVLLHLPAALAGTGDLLLLLGSGSRPQRERMFTIAPGPKTMTGPAVEIAAAAFYAPLRDLFGEPNIEAGYVDGQHLHIFQRANRSRSANTRITYDAASFVAWILGRAVRAPVPTGILHFSLGTHDGVPLGITDASAWSRAGCVFTAVAEDTENAYADGACIASMVGWMGPEGEVHARELLAGAPKVEAVTPAGDGKLWMATDADDPARPSELLEVDWDPPPP